MRHLKIYKLFLALLYKNSPKTILNYTKLVKRELTEWFKVISLKLIWS
jgi:hypothetical protein